jgi:signal peptidase
MTTVTTKRASVFVLVVALYVFLGYFALSGKMSYLLPSIAWSLLALLVIQMFGFRKLGSSLNKPVVAIAVLIGMLQVAVLVFSSLFTGFAKNPYDLTPTGITLNLLYILPQLIALELSRAYLTGSASRKRRVSTMAFIGFSFAFITMPPLRLSSLNTLPLIVESFGSQFLPAFAESLLATYICLLGGPVASLGYIGTINLFQWISPVLPNLSWEMQALMNTIIPVVGFVAVEQVVSPIRLIELGLRYRTEAAAKFRKKRNYSSVSWIVTTLIILVLLWGTSGLMGIKPSVVASGSMRPALEVGDMAIATNVNPDAIKIGDIIQYVKNGEVIIHRVIEIRDDGNGVKLFITKGDANAVPDEPVSQTAVVGKTILIIPKIGWVSIYLKVAAADVFEFLSSSLATACAIMIFALVGSIFATYRYRNQPMRRIRRRFRR